MNENHSAPGGMENGSYGHLEFSAVLEKISSFAASALGSEIILSAVPFESTELLREEHGLIQQLFDFLMKEESFPLSGLANVRSQLYKSDIHNAVLTPEELLKVRDVIRVPRMLKNAVRGKGELYPGLVARIESTHDNRLIEKHIEDSIDISGDIKDTASRELSQIRKNIRELSNRLRSRIEKILRRTVEEELTQDDFVSIREGRFVIPIRVENKRKLPGIIHGLSQTGSTAFIEPSEIIEMNNELSLLQSDEKREIYRILQNLTGEVGAESAQFLQTLDVLAHLDSLYAKARYAIQFEGYKPDITDENALEMKKIYHPLLRHKTAKADVIPLSIYFDKVKRGYLISGPNAGGKTVALKSMGLNLLMAVTGIFPLGHVRTDIRKVFASIGDNQSIENNLSTFSSQLAGLKKIVTEADKDSLILIDEICSGTDPQEGSALACGIMDSFLEMNLFFVVTTHQSSLKTYALNKKEIENASLEFDEKNLKPTYNFLLDVPGNSYAFQLAENMGFSRLILDRARNYLGDKQEELQQSISVLSRYRAEAEQNRTETERLKIEAEKLRADYDTKLKEFKAKKSKLMDEAKSEALAIVSNANKLVENTIREIREQARDTNEIKSEYAEKKKKIEKSIISTAKKDETVAGRPGELKAGDRVIIEGGESAGIIEEIEESTKNALVNFNGIKFKVKLKKLTKAPASQAPKKEAVRTPSATGGAGYVRFDVDARIDVRGMRVDEALAKIDAYLSDAILGNISSFTIVHGKGTGALRESIQEYLSRHHVVSSFRTGELVEGGAGVTIVEI